MKFCSPTGPLYLSDTASSLRISRLNQGPGCQYVEGIGQAGKDGWLYLSSSSLTSKKIIFGDFTLRRSLTRM